MNQNFKDSFSSAFGFVIGLAASMKLIEVVAGLSGKKGETKEEKETETEE